MAFAPICPCCGASEYARDAILWPALIAEWRLSPEEVEYIDRREGLHCRGCRSNLRTMAFATFVGQTRLFRTGWDTTSERHPRLFRRGCVTWPTKVHQFPDVRGETFAVPENELLVLHHAFADLTHVVEKINRYSSAEAHECVASGSAALLPGLREAVDEFNRRYSPIEDGALSLAMSLGIFAYRVLVRAKAAEALGWPADAIPEREALCRGLEAFWAEATRGTIVANPKGREEVPLSSGI